MFRQLLGNECALLSFFQCECQQNSPDDAEQDNIRKIPMNAVLPCFHSLDGHYRSMGQALARAEGNQRAVQRRLSGSQQQEGAERDKPTKHPPPLRGGCESHKLPWDTRSVFSIGCVGVSGEIFRQPRIGPTRTWLSAISPDS